MKVLKIAVVALLATAPVWAAEQRFPISLKGTIQTDAGRQKITETHLVTTPGHHLVLMIDATRHLVAIEEWNASLTQKIDRDPQLSGVQSLMENFRMALVNGKKGTLMANLEMIDVDWSRDGIEDHDGNLQLIAQLGMSAATGQIDKVRGELVGVLNDAVNGIGQHPNKLFRGRITSKGAPF